VTLPQSGFVQQGFSSRTNYSWLFVRASLILANCN
jgi:hypothetical protein